MSQSSFSSIGLKPELLTNLDSMGYKEMTPIQAKSLPQVLLGKDVVGQGKTGSGKTATFGLGLLQNLDVKKFRVQSLVLCPTRELADQVAKEIRKLARAIHNIKVLTLCGGTPMEITDWLFRARCAYFGWYSRSDPRPLGERAHQSRSSEYFGFG